MLQTWSNLNPSKKAKILDTVWPGNSLNLGQNLEKPNYELLQTQIWLYTNSNTTYYEEKKNLLFWRKPPGNVVYGQPNFSSYIGRSYGCGEFSPTSLFFPSLTLGMMSKCGRKRHLPKTSIELEWTVKFHKSHKKFGWHGDSSLFFKCFHKTSNTLSGHY